MEGSWRLHSGCRCPAGLSQKPPDPAWKAGESRRGWASGRAPHPGPGSSPCSRLAWWGGEEQASRCGPVAAWQGKWHSGEGAMKGSNYGPFESSNYCGEGGRGACQPSSKARREPHRNWFLYHLRSRALSIPPRGDNMGNLWLVISSPCLCSAVTELLSLHLRSVRDGLGLWGAFSALWKPKAARGSWGPTAL